MQNILDDFIVTDLLKQDGTIYKVLTWHENRYLIGWGPWLGCDKDNVFEGHLALNYFPGPDPVPVFMLGPHKEASSKMYDEAGGMEKFFPSGYGIFISAGSEILLELHGTDTGSPPGTFALQGSARVFSVLA
jgi:hypothetical protein